MNVSKGHIRATISMLLIIIGVFIYRDLTKQKPLKLETPDKTPDAPPAQIKPPVETEEDEATSRFIEGKVLQYGNNRVGDIDKLLLETKQGQTWVHFPPHTAGKLLVFAQQNKMVKAEIDGDEPLGEERPYELVSLESVESHQRVVIESIPPPPPSNGIQTEVSGTSIQLQTDEHGQTVGFVLAGKLIELKPRAAENLAALLGKAKSVRVKGWARGADEGFVNSKGLVLVKPVAIIIDSINYMVQ